MIDFRYHLVSIIAVFLALTVGIVVGTTALNGGIVDTLRASNTKVIRDKRSLETSVNQLRSQLSRRDDFATAVAPRTVAGRLTGQRVLFVSTPGASDDTVAALEALVSKAGGKPTGLLRLQGDLLDPAKSQVIDDVVASVAPAGLDLPTAGDPGNRAAVELAAAVTAKKGLAADAAAKIVGGFTGADLVAVSAAPGGGASDVLQSATMAVLVTPGGDGTPPDQIGKQRQRAVLAVARALDNRSAGVVVTGPSSAAETGGLLAAVRADSGLSSQVSSVDSVEASYAQIAVVLALAEQATGNAGRYGQGPGSQAAVPTSPPS